MKDHTELLKRLAHHLLVKTAGEDEATRKDSAALFYEISNVLHESTPIEQPQDIQRARAQGLEALAARDQVRG